MVNSQRQLWSVAGYLSMVHHTLFGLEAESDGLHVRPFVTAGLRDDVFAGTDELVLNDYPYRGRRVTVVLHLPESGGTGALTVGEVSLNGTALGGDLLPAAMLEETNRVDVTLTAGATAAASLTEVSGTDWRDVYGPRTPRVTSFTRAGDELTLALDLNGATAADVRWTIYRDGEPVADDLPGTTTLWTDPAFQNASGDLTAAALSTTIPGASLIVAVCSFLFGFSTLIGWCYYGEKCVEFLLGSGIIKIYRLIFTLLIMVGSVVSVPLVWALGTMLNGFMAFPNLIGMLFLLGTIKRLTSQYFDRVPTTP